MKQPNKQIIIGKPAPEPLRKVVSGPVFKGRTIQRVPTDHKPRSNIYKGR
jgi:hypothetical protein